MANRVGRFGRVALMGPPNAGKSTLLNALLGQKVTIVTPLPQTTRNQIVGILTDEGVQAVFMDTPGLTQIRGRLGKSMTRAVWESLRQADVIMLVLDGNLYARRPEFLERDLAPVAEALANDARPMIVVINKVDLLGDKSRMLPLFTKMYDLWPKAEIFPLSALLGDGLPDLKALLSSVLPEGMQQFPDEQISTLPVRFMAAEIIREKLFLHLRQEVPYNVAVEMESWKESEERGQIVAHAVVYVTKSTHKAMVIGQRGSMIKRIGMEARKDIQALLERKVYLELWVKVRENWAEDPFLLQDAALLQGTLYDGGTIA